LRNGFAFRTGTRPEQWPGIDEPDDSVTFDLSPIFDGGRARFAAGNDAVNAEVISAFVWLCPPEERLLLLDWQHRSFWLVPHLPAVSDGPPPVEPFPER
jgi:hypothetical protein